LTCAIIFIGFAGNPETVSSFKRFLTMTVTIYSKPACMQCFATYRAFDRRGISYHIIDISKDSQAQSFVVQLGYRQMPVVVAGDMHWAGFRPDMIRQVQ